MSSRYRTVDGNSSLARAALEYMDEHHTKVNITRERVAEAVRIRWRGRARGLRSLALVSTVMAVTVLTSACATESRPTLDQTNLVGEAASELVAECLYAKGWAARVGADGGVSVEVPKGQEERYEAASAECWGQVSSPSFNDVSAADRERYYKRFLEIRECVVEIGIDMPPPPSFQAWVDMDGLWSPYADIDERTFAERAPDIEKDCPSTSLDE